MPVMGAEGCGLRAAVEGCGLWVVARCVFFYFQQLPTGFWLL
jgi:hypothetical protein